ncbi:protein kinase [Tychonema sp. LEGE 07199]|uniref:serine/threonine-protein kinase n=1 Tax=unclassified Tychonema TaxID=2642144 RepID=UPI00187F24FF|nr:MULTISPECIES: serine/threonine-protein kinase [unclassified Tychonema]MBE9123066.1 protein kinase [Tychonema sp. LEGE 07199]MBE9132798.1 protein kinase [Tychonema sp. LEGE 07196]
MVSQLLDGRYQIIEVIETGEFGQTYLAKDIRRPGEPQCFVKHLRPGTKEPKLINTTRRLFQKEAEVLEKLGQHDQIPQLFAYFEESEEFFLVESFIPGHSLSTEIVPGKPLAEEKLIPLLKELLEILVFVHGQGVIHRDIKPANLIRRYSDNKLVLIDFGSVKEIHIAQRQAPVTVRIGTLEYMPIEQFQYNPQLNSDIYALGMIGIQAMTGLPAYDLPKLRDLKNSNKGEIVWRHLAVCSQALADVLDNMVRYDYRERYQSAAEALADLRKIGDRSRARIPKLTIYREEVDRRSSSRGDITVVGRRILEELRVSLELLPEEAEAIEDEVLNPYRKYRQKGERYEQSLQEAMQQEYPFSMETRDELKRLQQVLGLTDEDAARIEELVVPKSLFAKLYKAIATVLDGHRNPNPKTELQPTLAVSPEVDLNGKTDLSLAQPAPTGATPTERIATPPAIVPKEPRKFNPYLAGATIAALLAAIGGIYGYLKWQEGEQGLQQEAQQFNQIESLYKASNYEGCINQIPTIPNTNSSYDSAQKLQQQCQAGLRWKNAKVKNFAQHSDAVGAVAFSPDGLMLASGSKDKTVQIWDLATGKSIRTFAGDSSTIWSVAFDSSGTKLATGTGFWRVMLWDLKTGEGTRLLDHTASVWSVAFSPDDKLIASGSGDKTTKISDAVTGSLIYNLPDHTDFVYSVAFTPDGKSLVSGSKDKKITIVDVATGNLIKTLEGHGDQVRSVAVSPDGKTIVSGSYDETIKIWDIETGDLIRSIKGHSDDVVSVAISPDGQFIASGSKDKTIKIWDFATGELLNTLTGHTDEVYVVAFSPDGKTIASGSKDNTIKLWLR